PSRACGSTRGKPGAQSGRTGSLRRVPVPLGDRLCGALVAEGAAQRVRVGGGAGRGQARAVASMRCPPRKGSWLSVRVPSSVKLISALYACMPNSCPDPAGAVLYCTGFPRRLPSPGLAEDCFPLLRIAFPLAGRGSPATIVGGRFGPVTLT